MQSQQKRVKWSRGETAEALEERTDTGITQASVELMENCIPDIYGNISRRPALKPIPYGEHYFDYSNLYTFGFNKYNILTDIIPFYISENDYILIGICTSQAAQFIRIKDGVCVYKVDAGTGPLGSLGKVYSYAQQNNYLLIAGSTKVVKITIDADLYGYTFTPNVKFWEYSAGWYAPNGTQTKIVSGLDITGAVQLVIKASSLSQYSKYDITNISTSYNALKLTFSGTVSIADMETAIPLGSIVKLDNAGCYMRVEGYFAFYEPFDNITFDGVLNPSDSVPSTGVYCKVSSATDSILLVYTNGSITGRVDLSYIKENTTIQVKNSGSNTGFSTISYYPNQSSKFPYTWIVNGGGSGPYQYLWMYGSLLTPVSDGNAIDNLVNVEYGYINLTPESFAPGGSQTNSIFPHPEQLCFNNQRLWAGSWIYYDTVLTQTSDYAVVLGSQIARYNDFKNDYNQENEPITIDILTSYKEKIVHLIDYNGLKIFTDSFEYIYENGGVVKQSANGALESCKPIVFESLCLYADKTGNQIRAMQYEFQANIFNSSCINQFAPHDLVWYPIGMAGYEDKVYSTGKYLFIANTLHDTTPTLAVCNFVPSNQANIWSRWTIPERPTTAQPDGFCGLFNVLDLKGNVIFLIKADSNKVIPCMLDFTGNVDLEGTVDSATGDFNIAYDSVLNKRLTLYNMPVAVYSNGEFQFATTTNASGKITDDLSGLTNITAGLMINSKIVSHPIDVGGKTKSVKKRIGKAQMSVHDTEAGVITINGKTGYMNPAQDHICFYGVSGMKDEVKYTITNKNGAMFHLESLLMNIEYGTLDS